MKKKIAMKKYLIFILLLISNTIPANTINVEKKFVAVQQVEKKQDSILFKEYERIKKLVLDKKYAEGLKCTLKLYEESRRLSNIKLEYLSVFLIGDIYDITGDFKKSLEYYKTSILIYENLEKNEFFTFSNKDYSRNLLRIGAAFQKMKIKDSAKIYYKKLDELNSNDKEVLGFKATSYGNMIGIYQKDSLYDKAEAVAIKAINIYEKLKNKRNLTITLNNLANIYLMRGDFLESKRIYSRGIKLIEKDNGLTNIRIKGDLYYNLAWAMRKLKEFESYDKLEIYHKIQDSLRDIKTQELLKRVEGEYNVDVVRKEEEIKKQKAQRNTWILGISSFSIIAFLAFFLNQYKLRQKNLRLALSQKETASQIDILNASLKGQEAERKRISQELHDGVLGKLFGSRMGLGYLELKTDTETQQQYQKFLVELQNIEKEIREVSHQLSNDVSTSETSFVNAVNQLLKEKSQLGKFESQLLLDENYDWKKLDGIIEMNLFRILQECLQNILKHAKANNVVIKFTHEKNDLLVEIKDNGVGFDTSKKKKGIGLKNIQSRVVDLRGIIKVLSDKNKGTVISIRIPIV